MLRSASKNYQSVTVVVDPADYQAVLDEMRDRDGETTLKLRERLAIKAFIKTSDYDRAIATYLNENQKTETSFSLSLPLVSRLRYGENPHQRASLYGTFADHFEKLHGKDLSFNNLLDITAAADLIEEFREPTVAILKHTNPCGVGSDPDLREAWLKGVRHRQAGAVRRDHHLQSAARSPGGEGDQRDFQRSDHRAGIRDRRARLAPEKEKPAPHADRCNGHSA